MKHKERKKYEKREDTNYEGDGRKSVKEEKISPRDRLSQFISMPSLRNPIIEFTLFFLQKAGNDFF